MRIHRNDMVVVTTGDGQGNVPHRVIQVLDGGKRLLIEGINTVFKHVKRGHPKSPSGGRLRLDLPIDSSNVMLYCDTCAKGVRVGYRYAADGAKERWCRKCGKSLGAVSPPRAAYAKK